MCLKTLLFCCLVTLVVCFICDSEALDETGDGVCIVRLSTRQRRRKTFNVQLNQWCGRKKCISKRYKTETYLIWTNHTVCCHGYKHNSDLDICSPICSTGCSGGRCIGPDRCYCDPPSYLDPELKNTCITPTCTPSCTNAVCHANNTCVCKENFSAYNSTHCFQCDVGYTPDESLNCFPVCSQCINSECVAPSVCQCLEGYKPKNDHVCEPVCDCVNAVCVRPHTCECLEGYIPLNDTTCVPKCDNCSNGDCIAPNTCSCREGYELIDGVCKPKCSVCENGFCTAPEVCTCNVGYHKTSEGVCVKPCDSCEGYCDDGKCVKWNCSSTPIKSRRTRKGGMYQEKELSCCDNWEYHGPSDTCQPVCPSGCLNGNCIDVDVCECPPHLVKSKNKQNYTICELSCVNSRRDDVGTCECYNDYVKLNETFCIRNCPPGYFNDPIECSPLCDQPCDHGNCTSRNTCTCDPGYENKDELTCAPECELSCAKDANEHCVAPDLCQCIDSYRRINETCVPVCDQSCVNGICVSHNVCECDAGYELDDNNKFNCLLICNGHCAKRHCLSPNNCTCNEGYESAGDGCKPKCDSCENGDCIEPNKCKCHEGYEETSEGSCKPKCTMPCINGYCSAPNECSCHEGFYKNETGPNECYPKENVDCSTCGSVCQYEGDDYCCFDKKPITVCTPSTVIGPVKAKNTSLAGLGLYWSLGAVVGLILLVIVVLVMQRLWIKRKEYEDGSIKNGARLGSVMYTHPHSLLQRRASEDTADTPSENTVTLLSNDANNHV